MEKAKEIYSYDPKKKKRILAGLVFEGNFFKEVTSKHFMYSLQAYGIQEDVIDTLIEQEVKQIVIKTPTEIYGSDISKWLILETQDYGHGRQKFLPVKEMDKLAKT
jgi:hypothetical protein